MGRQVTIIHDDPVALPNGVTYESGAVVMLTDAQWGLIRPEAIGTIVQDDGVVDFGEANFLGDNHDVNTDGATEGAVLAFLPGDVWGPSTEVGGGGASAASELSDYAELARLDAEQELTNKTITDFSNFVAADEQHVQVYNDSGVLLGAGTPVYLTGYHFIGTAAPTVAKADASSAATMPCIGLTNEVIGNGNYGEVVVSGFIDSVNTSAFSNGDTLYVSETAGELTATPPFPDGINQKQPVAVVLYAAGGGKLQVLGYGVETAASETQVGVVELATAAEVDVGTDDVRAISPASLAGSALRAQVDALGATLHTDAAADPSDGVGEAGDFHLRRDTGVLTGPKALAETVLRGADTYDQTGGSGKARWARRFKKDTGNQTVTHVSVAFGSTTAATEAKAYLLDDARNIIAQTDVFTCAADALSENVPLLSSVELVAGNHYWFAIKQETGISVSFKAGNTSFPDSGIAGPDSGDTYAFWNAASEDFTEAPAGDGAIDLKYYFELVNVSGSTWTGADTLTLVDKSQVMVVINHGADADFPRPANIGAGYWIGSVAPNNMEAADLFYNTA